MNLYTLRAAMLLPAFMLCGLLVSQTCTVNNLNDDGAENAVWLMSGPYADVYTFDEPGTFTQNEDGTAQLTGTLFGADSGAQLELDVNFENGSSWSEWSAMGRGYKDEPGVVGDNYLDYVYYEMSSSSTLTIFSGDVADVLTLTHAPANFYYGFQVGLGANATTAVNGLGGWFTYDSGQGGGQGDILLEGDCPLDQEDVDGCTDATACNYDADATVDDGSCLLATGCDECDGNGGVTDNPEAGETCDDGDADTENDVIGDDCVCAGTPVVDVPGCTDDTACNYDADATVDDGSCVNATGCDECDGNGGVIDNPEAGETCDDGDATTENDVVGDDCVCAGTTVADCPNTNADCSSAMAIGEGVFTADTLCGEGAALNCFATGATGAVWYAYTASATGVATVSSSDDLDLPDTRLSVYTGACDALECLASDDDGGEGFTSVATFPVTSGETYLVEWDDRWDAGEFTFEVSVVAGGVDTDGDGIDDLVDNCINDANADQADLDGDGAGDACDDDIDGDGDLNADDCDPLDATVFAGATCDDGDATTVNDMIGTDCVCAGVPDECANTNADCSSAMAIGEGVFTADTICGEGAALNCFATGATGAVWYAYTASATGLATVSSSDDLDLPDTRLSVYTGTCDALECLASDDDGGEGFTSITTFEATAGVTYLIEWDDRWDAGEFTFEVSVGGFDCPELNANIGDACDDGDANTENDVVSADCVCAGTVIGDCAASNTMCMDAIAIGEGTFTQNVVCGEGALSACGLPIGANGEGNSAAWYAYTASATGIATVSTDADLDQPDTRVSVYTGTCDALTCLTADDDGGAGFTSIATFAATAGETYLIEWDDRWDAGEFTFDVTIGDIPDCTAEPGVLSSDATEICLGAGDTGVINFTTVGGGAGTTAQLLFIGADGTMNNVFDPGVLGINFAAAPAGDYLMQVVYYVAPITGLVATGNIADLDGCFELSNVVTITMLPAGCEGGLAPLDEDGVDLVMSSYPNPSNGQSMTLEMFNLPGEGEIVSMTLVDVFGRTVNLGQFMNENTSVNRAIDFEAELENGVYYVRVNYNGVVETHMFAVSK